jgi:hypothetical protein
VAATRTVRRRNAGVWPDVYAAANRSASGSTKPGGGEIVQTARPRDIGALVLVVGVLLILFVLSLTLGTPAR